jgi:Holliday junction resolvasome RuvABC endonuclease subunit
MLSVLGIDPGTHESGWAIYVRGGGVLASGVSSNAEVLDLIRTTDADILAIEKIVNYGMAVGQETFDTCQWSGRMIQCWPSPDEVVMVPRMNVKKFVCGTGKAKDPQVRDGLIAMIGPVGSKKSPGPTYGVKSHAWSALGVAITAISTREGQ